MATDSFAIEDAAGNREDIPTALDVVEYRPMHHLKRVLCGLVLVAVALAPAIRADATVKPRIRAITGFITIDGKSYASQIQEAVTFLSQVRDAVKAAGYDVAGIRISTQPFPQYTRELNHTDAMAVLHGINDL